MATYLPANQGAALGLMPGGDADLVTITTPGGAKFTVARKVAPQFQGFVNEMTQNGYTIDPSQSGGYNNRNIAGTAKPSQHAYGNAIDLNWNANPRGGASNLPANVGDIAAKYGLAWGGNWKNPDPMHFEASRLIGDTTGADSNMTPGEMLLKRAIQRNSPAIGAAAPVTGSVATPAAATGMDRLKAALAQNYDPEWIDKTNNLAESARQIAGTSGNALGALGGALLAGVGGYMSNQEGDKKKAFQEQLRQGLAQGEDVKAMARLLMASPDPKQQAMGVELFAQSENAKLKNPESLGTTPQYYTDPQTGELRIGQLSNKGGFKPVTVPGQILPGVEFKNLGTSEASFNKKTGQMVGNTPIDVAGKASAEKVGEGQGAAKVDLPRVLSNSDSILAQIESVRNDPYLPRMTGPVDTWLPNLSGDSHRVQAKIDQLGGKAFLEAFNSLKGAGAITDIEGKKATEALSRLQTMSVNDADYGAALDDFHNEVLRLRRLAEARAGGGTPAAETTDVSPPKARLKFNPATGELE